LFPFSFLFFFFIWGGGEFCNLVNFFSKNEKKNLINNFVIFGGFFRHLKKNSNYISPQLDLGTSSLATSIAQLPFNAN